MTIDPFLIVIRSPACTSATRFVRSLCRVLCPRESRRPQASGAADANEGHMQLVRVRQRSIIDHVLRSEPKPCSHTIVAMGSSSLDPWAQGDAVGNSDGNKRCSPAGSCRPPSSVRPGKGRQVRISLREVGIHALFQRRTLQPVEGVVDRAVRPDSTPDRTDHRAILHHPVLINLAHGHSLRLQRHSGPAPPVHPQLVPTRPPHPSARQGRGFGNLQRRCRLGRTTRTEEDGFADAEPVSEGLHEASIATKSSEKTLHCFQNITPFSSVFM